MAKVKAVFYLPLADNDGRNLAAEIDAVQIDLYARFVGWTDLGYVKGVYRMADGTQSRDESAAFAVVLDEDRLVELEQALLEFKAKTTQESIYLEIQRNVEIRFL